MRFRRVCRQPRNRPNAPDGCNRPDEILKGVIRIELDLHSPSSTGMMKGLRIVLLTPPEH